MITTYDLKVGYSCNNRCKHCVIEDSKDKLVNQKLGIDLKTEECFSQVDYAVEKGAKFIVLTGGEPTIREDFPRILEYCKKYNLDVTIQTNGRQLTKTNVIDAICAYNNIRCVVALHGSNPSTHDYITQINGSFRETCDGIKYVCGKGKLVILKVVISKINMYELPDIVKLASELGVKYACFAFPHGQGGARKNFDEVIPTYSELAHILKQLTIEAKNNGVMIEFEAIPYCVIPYAMQSVGELKYLFGDTLCTQVREETFDWEKVRKSIKRKCSNCSTCDMTEFCEGVWSEYAEAFGMNELKPIKLPIATKKKITQLVQKTSCCRN